jgi:hypothetical protein
MRERFFSAFERMILSSKDFDNAKNENISSLKFLRQSIQDKKTSTKKLY